MAANAPLNDQRFYRHPDPRAGVEFGRDFLDGTTDGRTGRRRLRDLLLRRRCAHDHADHRSRNHQLAGFFHRRRTNRKIHPARRHERHAQSRRFRPAFLARRDAAGQRAGVSDQSQWHSRRRGGAYRCRRLSRVDTRCREQRISSGRRSSFCRRLDRCNYEPRHDQCARRRRFSDRAAGGKLRCNCSGQWYRRSRGRLRNPAHDRRQRAALRSRLVVARCDRQLQHDQRHDGGIESRRWQRLRARD